MSVGQRRQHAGRHRGVNGNPVTLILQISETRPGQVGTPRRRLGRDDERTNVESKVVRDEPERSVGARFVPEAARAVYGHGMLEYTRLVVTAHRPGAVLERGTELLAGGSRTPRERERTKQAPQ